MTVEELSLEPTRRLRFLLPRNGVPHPPGRSINVVSRGPTSPMCWAVSLKDSAIDNRARAIVEEFHLQSLQDRLEEPRSSRDEGSNLIRVKQCYLMWPQTSTRHYREGLVTDDS